MSLGPQAIHCSPISFHLTFMVLRNIPFFSEGRTAFCLSWPNQGPDIPGFWFEGTGEPKLNEMRGSHLCQPLPGRLMILEMEANKASGHRCHLSQERPFPRPTPSPVIGFPHLDLSSQREGSYTKVLFSALLLFFTLMLGQQLPYNCPKCTRGLRLGQGAVPPSVCGKTEALNHNAIWKVTSGSC